MIEAITQAEQQLTREWRRAVTLHGAHPLPSPHGLWRSRVEGADDIDSVIVKRVTATEFSAMTGPESQRLLNEWACLEFLADSGVTPRLLAAGGQPAVLVLEDLGDAPTVLDLLRGDDADFARAGVIGMAEALAAMHDASIGRQTAFAELQALHEAASPRSDSTFDLRQAKDQLGAALAAFDREVDAIWEDVAGVERHLHDDPTDHTFLHADAGPQNCLMTPAGGRFIDFEFGAWGHPCLDLVSARLGFPHSANASEVPLALVEGAEAAYLAARAHPVRVDFSAAITDAAAHWAVVRFLGLWQPVLAPALADPTSANRTAIAQALLVYRGFVDVARSTGRRRALAEAMERMSAGLAERLDVKPAPPFPAFAALP